MLVPRYVGGPDIGRISLNKSTQKRENWANEKIKLGHFCYISCFSATTHTISSPRATNANHRIKFLALFRAPHSLGLAAYSKPCQLLQWLLLPHFSKHLFHSPFHRLLTNNSSGFALLPMPSSPIFWYFWWKRIEICELLKKNVKI